MFRLLRVIIRPSNEPTQGCLIPSALWDYTTYCKRYGIPECTRNQSWVGSLEGLMMTLSSRNM